MQKSASIQALRGLAFLSIFVYHSGIIPSGGLLGVSIFFVLSGFLLMYRSNDDTMEYGMTTNLNYSWRHIRKLYPLHIITSFLALPFLIQLFSRQAHATMNVMLRLAVNVLLLQSWFPWESIRYSMNNLSWFLSCMAFLYFMFPIMHNYIVEIGEIKKKFIVMIGIWLLMWVFGFFANYLCVINDLDSSFCQGLTYNNPVFRLGDFLIGCIAGSAYRQININFSRKTYTYLEIGVIVISVIFILVDWNGIVLKTFYRRFWESVPALIPLSVVLVMLFMRSGGVLHNFFPRHP